MAKNKTHTLELEVNYFTQWVPPQIEEGHGYHDIGSYNDVELGKIVLILSNGNEIDITNQMDKFTRDAIYNEILDKL
jgi:hypothetical protein